MKNRKQSIFFYSNWLLLAALWWGQPMAAKAQKIGGEWNGMLYQEEGGLAKRYYFSMMLEQNGKNVSGVSRITMVEDSRKFGQMEVIGSFDGKTLRFSEPRILSQFLPDGAWCLKKAQLKFRIDKSGRCLEGKWEGSLMTANGAVPCSGGSITICQLIPIALH